MFELLDAVVLLGPVRSFPWLSLSPTCQRKWPSLYQAVEEGRMDEAWLRTFLAQQVPAEGIRYWALDCTNWLRTHARTLPDRQYVYRPTPLASRGTVDIGYSYSLLDWVPEDDRSWAMSVDVVRVPSTKREWQVGIEQVQRLSEARQAYELVLDIVTADAKYGNHKFLRPLRGQRCGVVVAMRRDRVLYRAPTAEEQRDPAGGNASMAGGLPSRSQRRGISPMSSWPSPTNAGDRSSCGAGMACTNVRQPMPRWILSRHGSIWSGRSRPMHCGWRGRRLRPFR
jgi:hypothetical protein